MIGGDDGSCNLASVEFYNPNTDKWTLLPTCMSTGRSYAGQRKRLCSNGKPLLFVVYILCTIYSKVHFSVISFKYHCFHKTKFSSTTVFNVNNNKKCLLVC